ncbi:hypothetical protein QQP08_025380 [Theobroma cacao]|nr:hypothetical protein QQP08_025380 [Theobroma cacao]
MTKTNRLTAIAFGFHKEQKFSKSLEIEETDVLYTLQQLYKGCALVTIYLRSDVLIGITPLLLVGSGRFSGIESVEDAKDTPSQVLSKGKN